MKNILAALIILACFIPVACKKKTKTGIGYSVQPAKGLDTLVGMDAKINGAPWHSGGAVGYKIRSRIDSNKVDLIVNATQGADNAAVTLTFTVTNYTGPNTYAIDAPAVSAACYLGSMRHFSNTGQVVVSSDGPYGVIGTFSFTADTVVITDGVFNVAQP